MKKLDSADLKLGSMNSANPLLAIRAIIRKSTPDCRGLADMDISQNGGDLLTLACQEGKRDLVEYFIKRGANISKPVDSL